MPAPLAHAATITVTTTADELNTNGQCSLREAITNANANSQAGSTDCSAGTGNDTITFGVSGTITLCSTLLIQDTAGLTITGPEGGITISGDNTVRVFSMHADTTLTLEKLTVANGKGGSKDGGGSEGLPVMGRIGVALSGRDRERNQTAASLHAQAG